MPKKPLGMLDAGLVRQAIDSAREYAENKGVAMTVERLAVCLGIGRRQILEFVAQDEKELNHAGREMQELLKMACEEIAASQVEHGMTHGNNPSMDILLLKNNHSYKDKAEQATPGKGVVFIGEDNIPE